MSPLAVARVLAAAGAVVGLVLVLFFLDGFEQRWRIPLGLWAGAPLPLAFRRVAGTSASARTLAAGLALAGVGDVDLLGRVPGPEQPRRKPGRPHRAVCAAVSACSPRADRAARMPSRSSSIPTKSLNDCLRA